MCLTRVLEQTYVTDPEQLLNFSSLYYVPFIDRKQMLLYQNQSTTHVPIFFHETTHVQDQCTNNRIAVIHSLYMSVVQPVCEHFKILMWTI